MKGNIRHLKRAAKKYLIFDVEIENESYEPVWNGRASSSTTV
ncbi:hypothetical protein [Alicyclobacillus hesperidum]|nr:hypothetical protein [Alicyclobacillus hesperidum]